MANKAVVGAMAIGLGGYVAVEHLKDWAVERERRNQEQAQRDHEAEMERRLEEKLRKQGNRSAQAQMSGVATDVLIEREFQMKVYSHLEEMLFGLTVKVGEEGAPLHNRNLHMLNLPLMSNEYDKEDLMLAAALALGDSDVVDRVIESFSKQRLGIGLKKFTKRSILNIISILQSLEDPDIDHSSLGIFVMFGILHPGLRGEKPKLLYPKDPPSYSDNLSRWGEKFGMHVSHKSSLQMESKVPRNRIPRKSDYARFHFHTRFHEAGSEGLILSNFRCAFDTPYIIEQDGTRVKIGFDFDKIRLPNAQTKHSRRKPDLDAIAHIFASKIAAGMAREAAKRLSRLLKLRGDSEEGISLEHISIHSGKGSDLLQHLAVADMNMISGHNEKISSTLNDTLLKVCHPQIKKI